MNFNSIPSLITGLIPDPQDDSDGDFNAVGGEIFATSSPWASWLSVGNPFAPAPTIGLPAVGDGSAGGQGDPGSTVAVTSGGITINLIFDTAAMAAPASFRAGIQQAVAILAASITDKITVNIRIDYSGTGGGAAAGPDHGLFESYSSIRADLINNATPGDATFNALTAGSSIQGQSSVAVWNAQLKLWGLMSPNDTTTDDGGATFATDINPNLLVGVALHELTHAMGRVPYGVQPDIFDLFRFTSAGTRLFQGGATAPAAYFSLDGGNTKVADYGRTSDASDFLNSGVQGSNDPFNEFYNGATSQQLTAVDLKQLDALGFHLAVPDAQAPILLIDNSLFLQAGATQTISSTLLIAADNVSPAAQLRYTVTTGPTHGVLLLSGSATSSFTQADINNGLVSYHETASGATSDSFSFKMTDAAGNTSSIASFQIGINGNHAPVLTVADVSANAGQSLQAASLFSATDADGDALTYYFADVSLAANSGHFVVNGTVMPAGPTFSVSAAQLAQTTFVAGAAGTSDDLFMQVSDGQAFSSVGEFHVNVGNHAPVLTVADVSATAGQSLQAASLFSATDADGDALTYYFADVSLAANSGHFVVNGTAMPAGPTFSVSAAQLAQTTFVAGAAGTSDDLFMQVSDGQAFSSVGEFHVNVGNRAPTGETLSGGVIPENSPNGTVVGTVTGIDPDSGTVFNFSLTDDADGRFLIDAHTGQLTVADSSQLDYEAASSYGIVVRAADQGGLFIDKAFTILLVDLPGVTLNGDGSDNTLVGTAEADTINGLGGNDTITGGGGNDTIDGGPGIDTAVFSGNLADYQVTWNSAAQTFTVADQRSGSHDGTDTVSHVEQFQFADSLATLNFDGTGALASETFNNANGSHWVNIFDTVGNQSFVWSTSGFDASGALTSQTGLNHDGMHWLTLYDVNNQYSWTNVTINFDANWNWTSLTGTRDDGSHSITAQDVQIAYDNATWYSTPFGTNLNPNSATGPATGGTAVAALAEQPGADTSAGAATNDAFFGGSGNSAFVFSPAMASSAPDHGDVHIDLPAPNLNLAAGATASSDAGASAAIHMVLFGEAIALHDVHPAAHLPDYFMV
jgi:Cadherin-like/Cadherin domain/RTX calcium-binding nonapeptide repeat (4 copies)